MPNNTSLEFSQLLRHYRSAAGFTQDFATSGDPNEGARSGLPAWPAYSHGAERVMDLGDTIAVAPVPNKAAFDFYDAFYMQRLGRPQPF